MTRIGKIARLPHDIREQLNRRLQDGEQGKDLVDWLNSLPEVAAVLQAEFDGRPINEQNVSDWRAGGYRDWLTQQQTIELVQRLVADAKEVGEAAQTPLADQMAMWQANDKACAPITAATVLATVAEVYGGGDSGREIAALVLETQFDLPPDTLTGKAESSQTKPNQTKKRYSESECATSPAA